MSLGVALALFNAMLAISLMGGRQLYSSARDQAWPPRISAAVSRLHLRFNSPWVATTVLGATGVLWCLVPLDLLLILIGDGTAAIYLCMSLAALKGRSGVAALFDAEARWGLMATAATVIVSVGYYRLALHGKGGWSHKGPAGGTA